MGIFDFALKKKEEEKKQPLGSSFGGGWGISDLVNEQKKKELSPSVTSNIGAGAGINAKGNTSEGGQFDFALKTPEPEIITQKEQALAKVEETFSTLDKSIETNYKRYQELGTQLDSLETELAEAPEELKWNLSLKYENLRTEHNKLVEQLQAETQQQKKVYQDYNAIRDSYEKDLELYNRKVEAENKKIEMVNNASNVPQYSAEGTAQQLKAGNMRELSTEEKAQQTFQELTKPLTYEEFAYPMAGLPEPAKKVVQAIGGMQGLRVTEPEIFKQATELKDEIYEYKDPLERIAKAHEMITGEPMADTLKELQEYEPPAQEEFKPTWINWKGDDPAVYGRSSFGMIQLSPKQLPEKYNEALGLVQQASQFTTTEQVGNFLQTVSRNVLIGNMAYSGIKSIYEAGKVYEARNVYDTKINKVIEKAKNVFDKQKAGKGILPGEYLNKNELEIFGNAFNHFRETGQYPTSMTVIRPNFLGQAGHLSLPNMVKAIQNAGKISPDMRNQIATMTLINRIELMNQLAKIDPTLTATLTTDFSDVLKAPEIPETPITTETPLPTDRPDIPVSQPEVPEGKAVYDAQEKELMMPDELDKKLEGMPTNIAEPDQFTHDAIYGKRKGASLEDYLDTEKIKSNFPVKFDIEKGKVTVRLDEDNYLVANRDLTEEQRFNDIYEGVEAIKEKLPADTKLSIPELKYEGTIKDFTEPTSTTIKREAIAKEEVKIGEPAKPVVEEKPKWTRDVEKLKTREGKRESIKQWKEATGYEDKSFEIDRGEDIHAPADPESGSPLYNLTEKGTYPEDVYSINGLKYYGTGEDRLDQEAYRIISFAEGKPNNFIKIYRAVEKDGKPIQPGDWVTTVRGYAKEHGESILKGDYKIVSKTVYARDLFTSGDSWLEYGYHPQERIPTPVYTGRILKSDQAKAPEIAPEPAERPVPSETRVPQKETQKVISEVTKAPDPVQKITTIKEETQQAVEKVIDDMYQYLKDTSGKGVDRGLIKTDEGYKRYAVSQNPKWYQDLYKAKGRAPTKADLKEEAIRILREGSPEDNLYPDENFLKLESQVEAWEMAQEELENIVDLTEPKVIERVIEKVVEIEVPRKPVSIKNLTTEEKVAGNKLIGQIQKAIKDKGFTKKEAEDIKRRYGGSPHLATQTKRMGLPELKEVLNAVKRARPKQIGYKTVVTPKTERKIQSLKDNLINKLQMDENTFNEVLKDVGVYKEPKYIDSKNFITETQGKDIIYRLIDESNILRTTIPYEKAVEKNEPIKSEVDKINKRIANDKNKGLKDPHDLQSMRYYIQKIENIIGKPVYPIYQDLIDTHLENKKKLGAFINEMEEYKEIISDKEAIRRVEDYIVSKSNLKDKPESPKKITKKEIELAKKIQDTLKNYEATARTEKFLDNVEHPSDMPQYTQFKKEMDRAKEIYESKGYDDLKEYLKDKEWGIISSGYAPQQVYSPKVRLYKPKGQTFGKSHIKVRTDIEYSDQDRNIIQRLFSYKKQMDNLVSMRPKVRALVTLIDSNIDDLNNPKRVSKNIEIFLKELKGYNMAENWFDRMITRFYAQAMQTIIMPSPVLSMRNLGQNMAFGFDKSTLIDPRNKHLTKEELDYFNIYVNQADAMKADWLMVGQKPLPGLATLTKIVNKIGIYPYTDLANRHWAYWAKINQVNRAFNSNKSLEQKMADAKFSDMELIEQKMALQILAKDGQEAMAQYIARVYTDNIHFLYDRSQRSPAEMGRYGTTLGNLMLFPRAYWEMLFNQSRKFGGKGTNFAERRRAFKVIASVIIGGILFGEVYKKVTGRRQNPYHPLGLLGYTPGGLALGTIQDTSEIYNNILMAVQGDTRAMAELATQIPNAADMFIPFYAYTLRGIEAATDTKNIDRKAIRTLRMIIDKEYEVRGGAYQLERNTIEKWQYFLAGAGVDVDIQERESANKSNKVKRTGSKSTSTKKKRVTK